MHIESLSLGLCGCKNSHRGFAKDEISISCQIPKNQNDVFVANNGKKLSFGSENGRIAGAGVGGAAGAIGASAVVGALTAPVSIPAVIGVTAITGVVSALGWIGGAIFGGSLGDAVTGKNK